MEISIDRFAFDAAGNGIRETTKWVPIGEDHPRAVAEAALPGDIPEGVSDYWLMVHGGNVLTDDPGDPNPFSFEGIRDGLTPTNLAGYLAWITSAFPDGIPSASIPLPT